MKDKDPRRWVVARYPRNKIAFGRAGGGAEFFYTPAQGGPPKSHDWENVAQMLAGLNSDVIPAEGDVKTLDEVLKNTPLGQ